MPRPLYPRERPGTHCTAGWVGPRAGLDVCEKSRLHRCFLLFFLNHSWPFLPFWPFLPLVVRMTNMRQIILLPLPKEGMLWIFPAGKIRRLRSGANPRSWLLEASMLTPRPPKPLIRSPDRPARSQSLTDWATRQTGVQYAILYCLGLCRYTVWRSHNDESA
jgi:hypothetical protein